MHTEKISRPVYIISSLIGISLIFIGARFLLAPEVAEQGFGLTFNEAGNYALHVIKGIRDIFSGAIILAFTLLNQRRALAIILGCGAIIPFVDMLIVLTNPTAIPNAAWIHGSTVVVLLILVVALLGVFNRAKPNHFASKHGQP